MGGLFREQGIDGVKRWLDPLFGPFVDDAYRSSRRDYLLPEPEEPATPSPTPSPPPPLQCVAPAPSLPESSAEGRDQANVKGRRRQEETTTRHRPMQYHSLAAGAPPGATDRPRGGRMLRGISSRDDRRRYAGKYAGDVVVMIAAEACVARILPPDALWSHYQIRLILHTPVGILVRRLNDARRLMQS